MNIFKVFKLDERLSGCPQCIQAIDYAQRIHPFIFDHLPQLENYAPFNKMGSLGSIAAICIVSHVAFYLLTAKLERSYKIFTKIFGKGLAIYVYALLVFLMSQIRNYFLIIAIRNDSGSYKTRSETYIACVAMTLITIGTVLSLWVYQTLGIKNTYNGESFGYVLPELLKTGPYKFLKDPQYLGITIYWLGYSLMNESDLGISYTVSSGIESVVIRNIYSKKEVSKDKKNE